MCGVSRSRLFLHSTGLDDEYRPSVPTIPWKGIAGLRDVLIHQYEGVSLDEVWKIVEKDLPTLRATIKSVLPPLDELEARLLRRLPDNHVNGVHIFSAKDHHPKEVTRLGPCDNS